MTKRQHDQIRRAAARGAKWLDKTMPGWSRKIRRRKLDLGSTQFCILGQIDGAKSQMAFDRAVNRLNLDSPVLERLGFDLTETVEATGGGEVWDALTDAWRDELKTRPR